MLKERFTHLVHSDTAGVTQDDEVAWISPIIQAHGADTELLGL